MILSKIFQASDSLCIKKGLTRPLRFRTFANLFKNLLVCC